MPAQYDPAQPACLFFDLDGVQFNAPVVFDNLIHKKEIPVTIGVFVGSGTVIDSAGFPVRYNRSFEFDAVNDDFVRFIETELLPDVELKKASDGRPIRISKNGKDRAIAGCSGRTCSTSAPTGAADTATSAAVRVWLTEKCTCGHAGKYGLPPGSSAVSGRSMPQTARTAYASSDTPHALPCAFERAGNAGCASVICVQKSSI